MQNAECRTQNGVKACCVIYCDTANEGDALLKQTVLDGEFYGKYN